MANCTDVNCGHPSSVHRNQYQGQTGNIGSGCSACAGLALQCKGLALASANCTACGHPISDHAGFGLGCQGACMALAVRCPGGAW